jgi:peptide/nickel transport system substrate-binding protein/microcin C transport system substrate-binding protein
MFADRATRQALSLLVDRELMAKRFFRGFFASAAGPWYKQSRYADPEVIQSTFNPQEALKLLNAAGWKDTDRDGLLDRVIDGRKTQLSFTILTSTRDSSRFLTLLQEDARQVGVEVNLKTLPGGSMQSLLTSGDFEAVENYAAEGLIDFDPFVVWHSSSTPPQGANYGRYVNRETDALLEKSRQELDPAKREVILREVYRKISADHAQIFLFNQIEMAYAVSKRVGRPADTLEYDIGQRFWWIKNREEMQAKERDEGRATVSLAK